MEQLLQLKKLDPHVEFSGLVGHFAYQHVVTSNFHYWRDFRRSKGCTRSGDNIFQVHTRHLIFSNKFGDYRDSQFRIAVATPLAELLLTDRRHTIGDKQTTIMGESLHHNGAKVQVFLSSASTAVSYRNHLLCSVGRDDALFGAKTIRWCVFSFVVMMPFVFY